MGARFAAPSPGPPVIDAALRAAEIGKKNVMWDTLLLWLTRYSCYGGKGPMNRDQWTLLALDFAGKDGLSPVQLQKSLFLLGKELPHCVEQFYDFVPYDYGPFCSEVYTDARSMESRGLVDISRRHGSGYREYSVTGEGREEARSLLSTANPEAVNYLQRVVTWAKNASFGEVVRSIYAKYPEYRQNSVFQG